MKFEITEPCDEPWELMHERPGGRYCDRCEKVVIDLAGLSRAQAERRVSAVRGADVCVQLRVDRLGEAVFAPPPAARAPHWARGLVLVAALTAGGCAAETEATPQAEIASDLGPPMIPSATLEPSAVPVAESRAVPAAELNDRPSPTPEPTAEQRALTARKSAGVLGVPSTPPYSRVRGRMPLHRSGR
ncbi:MAG TPA: hypothetical protein ENK57_23255 [Polyangiaceae bacterium]|nr:hypothetical protein [Polyangiaceae bacterium]